MIHIRAYKTEDIPALNRILNQASTSRFTAAVPFVSVRQSSEFFAGLPPTTHMLVACDDEGEIVGGADLRVNAHPRCAHTASLGIMVAEEVRRRGVGRALMKALLDLADNWLNISRVSLVVYANNLAAIPLYQQLGFAVEARLRRYAQQGGELVDSYIMARLRPGLPPDLSPPPPSPPQRKLSGDLLLRALEPGDAAAYVALRHQPSSFHFMLTVPHRPSVAEAEKRLASLTGENRAIGAFVGDQLVGTAFLNVCDGRRRHAGELDVMKVHDEFQGQGIARRLMDAILDIADNWLGLTRVGLYVVADNERAIELYKSVGFEVEGRLCADTFRHGGYVDVLVMSRLR